MALISMRLYLLVLAVLVPVISQAQQAKQKYLVLGSGWKYHTVLDQSLSRIKYKGSDVAFELSYLSQSDTIINQLDVQGSFGRISSSANSLITSTALTKGANINYRRLYYIMPLSKGNYHWYLGGGFLNHAFYREYEDFTNNIWQYDISSSLSIESLIKRTLVVRERNLVASWQLSVSVLSAVVRPAYNTSLPEGFIHYQETPVKAVLKSISYHTMNTYARVESGFEVVYYLLNKNALKVSYNWDFYHFSTVNKLSVASHQVEFGLLFNLSRPE